MRSSFATYKALANVLLRRVWLLYGILALVVLAPLLKPGYILTLDMVFTPHLRMPTTSSNDYLFRVFLHVLNLVLPGDSIEKLLLFVILLLAGVGVHRLVQYVNRTDSGLRQNIGTYVGGILYVINPFTYDRFMAGQYEVLLGYALLPWFVRLLLRFLEAPTGDRMLWLTACAVAISVVSIHSIGLMAIVVVIVGGAAWWRRRNEAVWRSKVWKFSLLALGAFAAASSYWLVPLALGKGSVATQIAGISAADRTAFATVGSGVLGKVANVVRLQGFWAEARGMYDLPQARVVAWGLIGLMVWALVIAGIVSLWRARQRAVVVLFALSAFVGGLLATSGLLDWLANHLPLLAGYRESEKFVALIALAYAVFAARGAAATLTYCRTQGGRVFAVLAAVLLLALPFVWTPAVLRGFGGQLAPVQYPADWSNVNARLARDQGDSQTLFLPWHLYMHFDFAGRIIANPATAFFDTPVIVSDDPEFRGAALSNSTPTKRTLDKLLPHAARTRDLGARLAALHIRYIVVAHDDDYRRYGYIAHRPDVRLVVKGATLDLYRNEAYRR